MLKTITLYKNIARTNEFVLIASVTSEEAMKAVLRLMGQPMNGDQYYVEHG